MELDFFLYLFLHPDFLLSCHGGLCQVVAPFYAPVSIDQGQIVIPFSACLSVFLSVCLSVIPSVCPKLPPISKSDIKVTFCPKLYLTFHCISNLVLSYKNHVWYEGTSRQYTTAGTKVNVFCQDQGQISMSHFKIKAIS